MRRSFAKSARRDLMRAREGSVAIEFGMIALPFITMIFAIMELGLIFVTDSVLENAAIETGRLVRTGQASARGMTASDFKASVCARMSVLSADCASRATVDVRVIPQFAVTPPDPMASGTFSSAGLTYSNGNPSSLMLVRVWYRQPFITGLLVHALPRMPDGTVLLTATTAFRNEPFPATVTPPPVTP